jgi:hypothetical protein
MDRSLRRSSVLVVAAAVLLMGLPVTPTIAGTAAPGGTVSGWGYDAYGQARNPLRLDDVVAVAAGRGHSLALRADGSLAGWGDNNAQQARPPGGRNWTAVAAGAYHGLALRADGTVVGWGSNAAGQTTVPTQLGPVTAIAAGPDNSLALRTDGNVVGWGAIYGSSWWIMVGDAVAIAAGGRHGLALRADGTVVGWGDDRYGQATPPDGLRNVRAIAAGDNHSLALKSDGNVVAWGDSADGQASVPAGLRGAGVVAIAAGARHSLALRTGGTVTAWGNNSAGQVDVPAGLRDVVEITAGVAHNLAVVVPVPPEPPTCGQAKPVTTFRDVDLNSTHGRNIMCSAGLDLVTGKVDGTYDPTGSLTRGQTATILLRALERSGVQLTGEQGFADVPAGHPHGTAIRKLAAAGVINGRSAQVFDPGGSVTRAQFAALLDRASTTYFAAYPDARNPFRDVSGVHEPAIRRLAGAGVIKGTSATTFEPGRNINRAQAASLFVRWLEDQAQRMR